MKLHPFNLISNNPFNKHTGSISESNRWLRFKNSTADSWGDQVDCLLLFWQEGLLVFTAQWTVRRERAPSISKGELICYLIWHSVCAHTVSREQGASIWINMETGGRGGGAKQPKRWLQKQEVHRSRSSQWSAAPTWDRLGMCRKHPFRRLYFYWVMAASCCSSPLTPAT